MEKTEAVTKACQITDRVLEETLPYLKAGISEREVVQLITDLFQQKQAEPAFPPIAAFGKNSAEVHHLKPTDRRLKKGDTILLDLGAKYKGYCADLTRTFFFGKVSAKQRWIYNLVLEAQKTCFRKIVPGMRRREADGIARSIITKAGLGKNFKHTLGHGVGRQVHQKGFRLGPRSRGRLKVGDIFTLEPAVYIEGWGGVRIEDTVVLTPGGIRALTQSPQGSVPFPSRPHKSYEGRTFVKPPIQPRLHHPRPL